MLGFLVFGTLTAVLVAELYVLGKREEELAKEEEYKCNCGCCHHEEDNEADIIIDNQGKKCECNCGCCHKEDEEE